MTQTAKIFANGRSQAVRLPAEFRFKGKEVFIRRDDTTGEIILSEKPETADNWDAFLKLLAETEIPDDFLSPDHRRQTRSTRDPFDGWPDE